MIIENRASSVLYKFLMSLNIKGKFILPVNICPIVPLVFKAAKIDVDYYDVNCFDYCIDYNGVKKSLANHDQDYYSGILFNHSYGYQPTPTTFFAELKQINDHLIIIDDKCLCPPDLNQTDSFSDLTLFSTGYAKYVDISIGGIGITKNSIDVGSFHSVKLNNDIVLMFDEFKMEVSEYVNMVQEEITRIAEHKKIVNSIYDHYLAGFDKLGNDWNNWRYNILMAENSNSLVDYIFSKGYFASKHYKPVDPNVMYTNANRLYDQVINLFNDKYISFEKAESLAKILKNY